MKLRIINHNVPQVNDCCGLVLHNFRLNNKHKSTKLIINQTRSHNSGYLLLCDGF